MVSRCFQPSVMLCPLCRLRLKTATLTTLLARIKDWRLGSGSATSGLRACWLVIPVSSGSGARWEYSGTCCGSVVCGGFFAPEFLEALVAATAVAVELVAQRVLQVVVLVVVFRRVESGGL